MSRKLEELAEEAAGVVESCNLTPEELRAYLMAWICEVATDVPIVELLHDAPKHSKNYDRLLAKGTKKPGKVIPLR